MLVTVPALAAWDALSEAECADIALRLHAPGFTFERVTRPS
jgi:hypothetical protein